MQPLFDYIDHNRQQFIDRLLDYLRMPSISAHGVGMGEVAEYLVALAGETRPRCNPHADGGLAHGAGSALR